VEATGSTGRRNIEGGDSKARVTSQRQRNISIINTKDTIIQAGVHAHHRERVHLSINLHGRLAAGHEFVL